MPIDWTSVLLAIITGLSTGIPAVIAALAAYRQSKKAVDITKNGQFISEHDHKDTNSKLTVVSSQLKYAIDNILVLKRELEDEILKLKKEKPT